MPASKISAVSSFFNVNQRLKVTTHVHYCILLVEPRGGFTTRMLVSVSIAAGFHMMVILLVEESYLLINLYTGI